MKSHISSIIPIGTPIEDARSRMEKEGFECTIYRNSSFSEQGTSIEKISYIYCDRSDVASSFTSVRWQAALIFKENEITRIALSRAIVGL